MDGMKCLFDADKTHFATWLWIYNEDRDESSMTTVSPKKPEAVPLYYAARLGFRVLAEHLIAEHPDHVNARGGWQYTPIHVAAREGHADILSLLLEHGADPDGGGINNLTTATPLYRASRRGKLEAGQCLLDRGADINAGNSTGQTPLSGAVYEGRIEFARMLLKRGARIDDPDDSRGETPLHWAVRVANIEAVRLLLEHGADVNMCNKFGKTPSQLTSRSEMVELLSKYGAKSVDTT
jgi:ankyrin repeat protein